MDIFKQKNYRAIVENQLSNPETKNRRGVTKLASYLKVHPTFLSKVLKDKAYLSVEQALLFCEFAKFTSDESQYFVDLLQYQRAGNKQAKKHYKDRLAVHKSKRENLKERLRGSRDLDPVHQWEYYESWVPQAIHIICQTTGRHTIESLQKRLNLDANVVEKSLMTLVSIGLVERTDEGFSSREDFVHTGKESPFVNRLHLSWRQKTTAEILARDTAENIHFTGIASLDADVLAQVRSLLLDALQEVKTSVSAAKPEKVAVLLVDFYEI